MEKLNFLCIIFSTGREQAACTGERLKELGHPYTSLLNSTMTRARDTANIIHTSLHDLPRTETDLLREGAPYPPEPPVGHYRPEPEVCWSIKSGQKYSK